MAAVGCDTARVLQSVQVIGAILILLGYVTVQSQRWSPHSRPNLAVNLVGSTILAVLALLGRQWGFLLLEGVWAVVSANGLRMSFRRRH
jgi:hypothetical protein